MSFERMYHAYIVMLHETQIYFGHNAYNKPTKLKLVKTCYVILFTLYSTAGDQSENIHFTREKLFSVTAASMVVPAVLGDSRSSVERHNSNNTGFSLQHASASAKVSLRSYR
jgi:hypothetical protein